jgi:hypothetical protein
MTTKKAAKPTDPLPVSGADDTAQLLEDRLFSSQYLTLQNRASDQEDRLG